MEKNFKLPKEFTEKWIEALRSRKYEQGRGLLYYSKNNSYCCLGVAGVVCGVSKNLMDGISRWDIIDDEDKLEIPSELIQSKLVGKLIELNDKLSGAKTFTEIADWIEENVELI